MQKDVDVEPKVQLLIESGDAAMPENGGNEEVMCMDIYDTCTCYDHTH